MLARLKRQAAMSARKRALLGSSAALPLALGLFGAPPALAQAVNMGQSPGNNILATGRTATMIGVSGRTTTITTSTISGGNAFNSFSQFREGRGNTVNLVVPGSARNLVNIVTGGPVDIQGTLNSYKNGVIGGNVVFADSYGFVVGPSGVVNVGSLSVATPSQKTIDQLISPGGVVNNALASQLIHANMPVSSDGSVLIDGQVIAQHGVRITAHDVLVAGSVPEAERAARQRAQFESTVNASGMTEGGAIVVRNGSIEIVAANNATIGGRLSANGVAAHGGAISIRAQHDVDIQASARLSSSATLAAAAAHSSKQTAPSAPSIAISAGDMATIAGTLAVQTTGAGLPGRIGVTGGDISVAATAKLIAEGVGAVDGGHISIKALSDTTVAAGASFIADALGSGNGGLVEISGKTDLVDPAIYVDLGAASGKAGTLLFDPDQLIIGGVAQTPAPGDDATVSSAGSLYTDGANVELDAMSSITIAGVIDTRVYAGVTASTPSYVNGLLSSSNVASTGNSGSILLSAPTITIAKTGALYADANGGGFTAGAVTLTAMASDSEIIDPSSAATSITIAGAITGGAISATATSTASTDYSNSAEGILYQLTANALSGFTGLNGGYVASSAAATVTVAGTANIQASGAVALSSIGSETASDPIVASASAASPLSAGVVVGKVSATVATEVQSGAVISSGGALSVTSANSATLAVSASTYSSSGSSLDVTVAYSTGSVNTSAAIDSGAVISKAASLNVASLNTNSFSTAATSFAGGSTQAGVAIAISDPTTSSSAELGAGIASGAVAGGIIVFSGSNTTSDSVQAQTTVGSDFLEVGTGQLVGALSSPMSLFFGAAGVLSSTALGSAWQSQGTSSIVPKGGASLALNLGSQSSTASIAATGSAAAPAVTAAGDIAVASILVDSGISAESSTEINSNTYNPEPSDPQASSSLAMAVDVAQLTHSSNAFIGSGVSLTGAHIGVDAQILVPITDTWTDFSTFSAVTSHISSDLGVVNDILTSYANATAQASATGLAGAVNYFDVTNNTTAWVGSGADLTQTGAAGAPWASAIANPGSSDQTNINWAAGVVVEASTTTQSINIGGNFSWLEFFGDNSGSSNNAPPGNAVGGSANVNIFSSSTVAGIGAGAIVQADTLDVSATTQDLVYGVAPTSGKGAGFALNGVASVLILGDTTSASISDAAQIAASNVAVDAEQDLASFSIAGAVGASKGSGVGISVALAKIDTDTQAFIGDNSTALATSGAAADDSNLAASAAGFVHADALSVSALTVGRLTTVSVAAQFNNDSAPTDASPAIASASPDDSNYLTAVLLFVPTKISQGWQQLTTLYKRLASSNQNLVNGKNSVSGAGSSSVDLTSLTTSATISSATVDDVVGASVSVQALNNTIIDTASGTAAIAKGAPGTNYSVGVAGAVAVALSTDTTSAAISNSTIDADTIAVQALAGGQDTAIGLAISVSTGSGSTSIDVSAAVSVDEINDGVNASIDSSTLDGTASLSPKSVAISADQNTEIGIGGGSLYVKLSNGAGDGLGIALTYAEIGDPDGGTAVSAVLSNSSVENVDDLSVIALDQSRILSGAAVGGGGEDTSGFAGAVVVNDISPTVMAQIVAAPAVAGTAAVVGGINVAGDVTVLASGGSNATLEGLISNAALSANGGLSGGGTPLDDSGLDFTGAALSPSTSSGAAILAVAGEVQAGKSNVGVSLVVDNIDQTHEALIDGVTLTSTGGVVSVDAADDSEILGIAFGVGVATGAGAGLGSIVYNSIDNGVIAQIGHPVTPSDPAGAYAAQVEAAAVSVDAEDGSTIRGAAGAVAISLQGGKAVGLSVAVDQISNDVVADIAGAKVTADEPLSDSSPLIAGTLASGTVLTSGQSNADILTVAIGAAISGQSTPSAPTPQQNLKTLVSSLAPSAPAAGDAEAPSPPPAPAPPSTPSSGLAGAGSLAISTESTSVSSLITDGADSVGAVVGAADNVLVLAGNSDAIAADSGALSISKSAGVGIGASIVVNTIAGATNAGIESSTVDAHALGSPASLDSGVLASPVDPSSVVTPGQDPSFADGSNNLGGIAVIATSRQTADTVAAVFSASTSSTALSANSITNVMGGATNAYADNALLDTNLASGEASGVQVTASSASFANLLDIGIADSGSSGAGTIVLAINLMDRATSAYVTNSTIGSSAVAAGAVSIGANAWEGTSGAAIGAAGSDGFGVAGSALVNTFQADTQATLDHGSVYAGALSVAADGEDGYFGAVGTGALGGTAGLGATVLVGISDTTTDATVGDANANSAATTINLTGPLSVSATSETDATSYVVGVSIGGTAGGAAQVSATIVQNSTAAALENSAVTVTAASSGNADVDVASQQTIAIDPSAGGLSGGGTAGVGASVNVVVLTSDDSALMAGDQVSTSGAVNVTSLSTRDVTEATATAGLGGQAAFAASVGVVLVGSGASSDAMSVLDNGGTLESADAATASPGAVTGAVAGGVDGISAEIIGGSVTAGSVDVSATSKMAVENVAGSLAIGLGGGGIGAAVGFTQVDQQVTADAEDGTIVAGSLTIAAQAEDDGSGHAARTIAAAGAGGLYVGLGAAVANSDVDNSVTAELGSTVNDGAAASTTQPPTIFSTSIDVTAADNSSVRADAYGFAGGAAAVGVSVALAKRDSAVAADVLAGANLAAGSVTDSASDGGETWAYSLAGAGGIFAGSGSAATATDDASVTAELMGGATIVAGDTQVTATDTPDAKGFAFGIAVGGAAVGASVALVTADPTVTAAVDDGVLFQRTDQVGPVGAPAPVVTYGGSLEVTAQSLINGTPATSFPSTNTLPASTDDFADGGTSSAGWAIAGAGGTLVGAQATYVETDGDATVLARIGSIPAAGAPAPQGLVLPMGDVAVTATNDTDQFSYSTGVSIGYVALGVVLAYANADANTQAVLGENVVTPYTTTTSGGVATQAFLARSGALTINATGVDTVVADALAGAGGVYAGSGAEAHTSDTSNLSSEIGANATIIAGAVTIAATHTDDYAADVDSLSAAAVGASASIAVNNANSTVAITLGANVTIQSSDATDSTGTVTTANAVSLTASNNFSDDFAGSPTDSIKAAGGGGINGFGASSTTNLNGSASVTIGGADSITAGTGGVIVLALSSVSDQSDTISLDTGGAIEGAGVGDYVTANLTNAISVGDPTDRSLDTRIVSEGAVVLATYAFGAIDTSGLVHTYGIAGVGEADASSTLNANQSIDVADAFVVGIGEIDITAGLNPLGTSFGQTSLSVDANAESYVYGLIAVPHTDATSNVTSNASVDIDAETTIDSGASVVLGAYHGAPASNANGTGHGYELGFIPAEQGGSNPNQPVTSASVTLDGNVTAGIYHDQEIDITCNNACTATGTPIFALVSGAPVLVEGETPQTLSAGQVYSYAPGETNVWQFVSDNFDPEVAPVLETGVSFEGQTTQTYILGQLYAAGGVVQINADTIAGKGTATSWGNPTITINNYSAATIILAGGAYIPDTPSGEFIFTGAASQADAVKAGLTLHVDPEAGPSGGVIDNPAPPPSGVTVNMYYAGTAENSNFGPTFINQGPISALGGTVSLYNANGWFGQIGDIISAGVNENAPYGGLAVSSTADGQTFSAADTPYADWLAYENFPGAANANGFLNLLYPDSSQGGSGAFATNPLMNAATDTFVDFVANLWVAQENPQRYTNPTSSNAFSAIFNTADSSIFNVQLYGIASRITNPPPGTGTLYTIDIVPTNLVAGTTALSDPTTTAFEFFSTCSTVGCNVGSYLFTPGNSDPDDPSKNITMPTVPVVWVPSAAESLFAGRSTAANGFLLTANDFSATNVTQTSSKIFGGPVAIKANIIDINGPIVSGIANDWSLTIDGAAITADQASYKSTGVQTYTLSTASATTIGATYDAATNVVTVANITASSGAGYVLLDGEIISTTALQNGSITVNGGLGQVTINNPTSAALVINDVANGSTVGGQPLQSRIKIVDTLKDQIGESATDTTTYLFTPGVGVATYVTGNGQDPTANAVPQSTSTTSTGLSYSPVIGARYQWDQTAYLSSAPDPNNADALDWTFTDASGNPLGLSATNPWFTTVSVTTGNSSTMPLFQETMSATANFFRWSDHFAGCDGINCNYTFADVPGSGGSAFPGDDGYYQFAIAQSISLTLTNSVKADNPIGINFNGNATGFLNIASVGGVTFAGNVGNASGLTSVATTGAGSNILETSNATLSTQSLLLSTPGAIGSAAQPFSATMTVGQNGAPTGAVQAAAGTGGVNLAFTSAAAIDSVVSSATVGGVTAYGDVTINALGNLVASTAATHVDGSSIAAGSANIAGRNINLSSLAGGVGSGSGASAAPLVLSANTTTGANGELLDGVINVAAVGDIALTGVTGDFRIGQIASASGDVTINVPNGVILNASGLTSSQALSADQLSAIETRLNLTNSTAALTETVAPFEKSVDTDYIAYEALLANATVSGASLTLTPAGLQLYAQAAGTAQLGAYNTLLGFGSIVSGAFTLNTAGVQYYTKPAIASLGAAQASAFNTLLADGTVASNGAFSLTAAGLTAYAAAAAAADHVTTATNAQIQAYATGLYNGLTQQVQAYAAAQQAASGAALFTSAANATAYETLLTNGTIGANGTFTLSAAGLTYYAAAAAAADHVATATSAQIQAYASNLFSSVQPTPNPTAAAIQAYATAQYAGYVSTFEEAFATAADPTGANWQSALAALPVTNVGNTPTINYQVAANSALFTDLTQNAVWKEGQLVEAIDQSALQPAQTIVGNAPASLIGRNIFIDASNGVGEASTPVLIAGADFAALKNGTLTDPSQIAALAGATSPGSVTVTYDSTGQNVVSISLAETQPLFVSATGSVSATSAYGQILLQATGSSGLQGSASLRVGGISAAGAVSLTAPASILEGASPTSPSIVSGGVLTLAAGSGDLGAQDAPLTFQAPLLNDASAAGSVWLESVGDAVVGRIFADPNSGTASLTTIAGATPGNISGALSGLAITGSSIILASSGNIGASATPLAIGDPAAVSGGFTLSGSSAGSAYLTTEAVNSVAAAVIVNGFAAGGALNVTLPTADVNNLDALLSIDLEFEGVSSSKTGSVVAEGGTLTMMSGAAIDALGPIRLTADSGSVALGQLVSGLSASVSTPAIVVTANQGAIAGNGDGQINLVAPNSHAEVILTARSDIGAPGRALSVETTLLSATTTEGGLYFSTVATAPTVAAFLTLSSAQTLEATQLSAAAGNITITGLANLQLDSANAGLGFAAQSSGYIAGNASTVTVTSAALALTAGGDIGSSATPFSFEATGALSGSAGGSAWLTSPDGVNVATFAGADGVMLSSNGAVRIESVSSPVTLDGLLSSANGSVTLRGRSVVMDQGAGVAAGGAIVISSAGDVTIGRVTSAATGSAIDIEAGAASLGASVTPGVGNIVSNGDAAAAVSDVTAGAGALLNAGVAIGPVAVDIANLSATADRGDLSLKQMAALHASDLSAPDGGVDVEGGAALTLDSVTAGAAFTAKSTAGALTLGTATSGATQTLHAEGSVLLTQLTATSGDVDVTSDAGSITGGSITAQRSASLVAALNNTGNQLTTTTGAATLTAGGLIDWNNIRAATTIGAKSTGGAIILGTTQSGGTQNLSAAGDITFVKLVATGIPGDAGDIDIAAGGAIHGGDVDANGALNASADGMTFGDIDANAGVSLDSLGAITAGNVTTLGSFEIDADGAITLGNISAPNLIFSNPGSLTFGDLTVSTSISFAASDIHIGLLRQSPGATGPLDVSLTGYEGGIGNSATLTIDAPNGVLIPELRERDATISTNASVVTIDKALIAHTLDLTTAWDNIWVDDQSASPKNGVDVDLFQPGGSFYLTQNATLTTTNAFVVQYGDNSAIVDQLFGGSYLGASFVRDFDRQGWSGDGQMLSIEGGADNQDSWQFPIEAFDLHLQRLFGEGKTLAQPGQPAVNMGDMGAETELVGDGLGFTIVVKRRH